MTGLTLDDAAYIPAGEEQSLPRSRENARKFTEIEALLRSSRVQ